MKRKISSGVDTNLIICVVVIVVLILAIAFFLLRKNNSTETFALSDLSKNKHQAFLFKSARAGVPTITCSTPDTNEKKSASIDKSKELCPQKNGKSGHWVCNDIVKNDPKTKKVVEYVGCGCMYPTEMSDPNNLFGPNYES